jgi:hypothetical protein
LPGEAIGQEAVSDSYAARNQQTDCRQSHAIWQPRVAGGPVGETVQKYCQAHAGKQHQENLDKHLPQQEQENDYRCQHAYKQQLFA